MAIKQDPDTGKWAILDGQPRYKSEEAAQAAYDNWIKRGKPGEAKDDKK